MLASLYSLFGNTEKYDHLTGSLVGLGLFLVGLIVTFSIYGVYLVDKELDRQPKKKNDILKVIIVAGFTLSLIISIFVGFSITRYNFCLTNNEICIADYAFSPFT